MRGILVVGIAGWVAAVVPAVAADRVERGTIAGFECGDNCYLTIRTADGEDLTALCVADTCTPWLEEAAMPQDMIGRKVEVTVGAGKQYDAAGTEMADFPAFTTVVVAGP